MTDRSNLTKDLLKQNGIDSNQRDDDDSKHMRLLIEKEEQKIQMMNILMFLLKVIVGIIAAVLGIFSLSLLFLFQWKLG